MADVGDKFIIELDSKMTNHNGFVYGVKDVPGLYVDDEIIGYLEKYDPTKLEDTGDALRIAQKDRDKWKKMYFETEKGKENGFSLWDEVAFEDTKAVIVDIRDNYFTGICENGLIPISPRYWKKTGRNFPQIAEILKEMRCENGRED